MFFQWPVLAEKQAKIAIGAYFRNEGPYLKEWIEYHRLIGVDHFYLWNNLSSDEYLDVLQPYIDLGIVELFDVPVESQNFNMHLSLQSDAMVKTCRLAEGHYKWLALIDLDEFIVPIISDRLEAILEEYEAFAGVWANWVCFGTSSIPRVPSNKLIIEMLTKRAPLNHKHNLYYKWILKPESMKDMVNIHIPVFYTGFIGVSPEKEPVKEIIAPYPCIDKLRINHYWARDEEYFYRVKAPRRADWVGGKESEFIKLNEEFNAEDDEAILRFVAPLREAVFEAALQP
ncbi:glycosyltransferase family 92 protein [Candidatus Protochlamydia phocaeensis]|uniref:glycosyltransferase family 92 protein n=1 Tax=Candidatus Protochlamydia phocaeensis TaxID=1414722 RepID=UPI0018967D5E|nr:glycosyltransferase family 92 protein [Candidatus Protochlamydia phocaeensis]